MIFVLDNYDSFTYNLVHMFYALSEEVVVRRNREITPEEVLKLSPEAIVFSPGPGRPENAGIMPQLIAVAVEKDIPLLGVCLGHQGIGAFFGAKVILAKTVMHGKISPIHHDGKGLFKGIPGDFNAVRYHSLALDGKTLPAELEVTCRTSDGEIMGIRHKTKLVEGIQYHPESILTSSGRRQLENFMEMARSHKK
ncbi:MAG: aminodeoxychorismate/anthranilate synthase component II [Lentisphaeria bacterium]|nr:aminodeoxychorismate/anthranilate synthase component II [Lentisphaeria bacterium]